MKYNLLIVILILIINLIISVFIIFHDRGNSINTEVEALPTERDIWSGRNLYDSSGTKSISYENCLRGEVK